MEGWAGWIPAYAGMTGRMAGMMMQWSGMVGMTVETMGVRRGQGVGSGRDAGQDYLEQPAHAGRPGSGGDRHGGAGARRCVTRRRHRRVVGPLAVRHQLRGARTIMTRCPCRYGAGYVMIRRLLRGTGATLPQRPGRGARTVMLRRRRRRDGGSAMTRRPLREAGATLPRRPMRGTRTVMTRRPGRGGEGYVITRCPQGGTQTAMSRCRRCGGRSAMTRCPRRVRGRPTIGGRHDGGASGSLPGGARCSRIVLHLPLPNDRSYWPGVGGWQRPWGGGPHPPAPSPTFGEGGRRRGLRG